MAKRIKRREDVSPERGVHEYGDVEFADTTNNKYPIDTPEHIRAAWSYINHADNAAKYGKEEVDDHQGPHQAGRQDSWRRDQRGLTSPPGTGPERDGVTARHNL